MQHVIQKLHERLVLLETPWSVLKKSKTGNNTIYDPPYHMPLSEQEDRALIQIFEELNDLLKKNENLIKKIFLTEDKWFAQKITHQVTNEGKDWWIQVTNTNRIEETMTVRLSLLDSRQLICIDLVQKQNLMTIFLTSNHWTLGFNDSLWGVKFQDGTSETEIPWIKEMLKQFSLKTLQNAVENEKIQLEIQDNFLHEVRHISSKLYDDSGLYRVKLVATVSNEKRVLVNVYGKENQYAQITIKEIYETNKYTYEVEVKFVIDGDEHKFEKEMFQQKFANGKWKGNLYWFDKIPGFAYNKWTLKIDQMLEKQQKTLQRFLLNGVYETESTEWSDEADGLQWKALVKKVVASNEEKKKHRFSEIKIEIKKQSDTPSESITIDIVNDSIKKRFVMKITCTNSLFDKEYIFDKKLYNTKFVRGQSEKTASINWIEQIYVLDESEIQIRKGDGGPEV